MLLFCFTFYQVTLNVTMVIICHAMVINKKVSKIWNFFILQVTFSSLKFFGTVFIVFIILSHIIFESSIILTKYLPFLQLDVEGFKI